LDPGSDINPTFIGKGILVSDRDSSTYFERYKTSNIFKMKPILATDVLRSTSTRSFLNSGILQQNMYHVLRESSPAPSETGSTSSRATSVASKRKADDSRSYANAAKKGVGRSLIETVSDNMFSDSLEKAGVSIARAASVLEKVESKIELLLEDNPFTRIVEDLREAMWSNNEALRELANAVRNDNRGKLSSGIEQVTVREPEPRRIIGRKPPVITLPATGKRPATAKSRATIDLETEETDSEMEDETILENTPQVEFRKAVRNAEKSTLMFNLDMGKVPIMNKETMKKKVTLALTSMATKKQGGRTSTPSPESVAAIDDVLSMVTNMTFFGNGTKTYKNNTSGESGAFCTVPVKYDFKSRDTRLRAEQVLRQVCNVQCSTPYPAVLRACIKKTIDAARKVFPEDYIKVTVDSRKMELVVSHRKETRGLGREEKAKWEFFPARVGLPYDVYDVKSRKVPDNLQLRNLPGTYDPENWYDPPPTPSILPLSLPGVNTPNKA